MSFRNSEQGQPYLSTLQRMLHLFDCWPRPVMNDPVLLPHSHATGCPLC